MIIPLYAHWSSPEWQRLLSRRLEGHHVILNPNDGPIVKEPGDRRGWQVLARRLAGKGAKILIYIDACKAERDGDDWHLDAKTDDMFDREIEAAEALTKDGKGYFLDDWAPQSDAHRRAMRRLAEGIQGIVVANPGCRINPEKWPARLKFITHETNGFPPAHHENYIALGLAKPPKLIGPVSWATNFEDGENPYERLPEYLVTLLP